MESLLSRHALGGLVVSAVLVYPASIAGAQTPIPTVTGPIPVTEDSYPELTVSRVQQVVDLESKGYVEEEFFVSGNANVYDWLEDGGLRVAASGFPYTTRILVRRPADPSRFSGNVVVELFNNTRSYDWAFFWGLTWEHIVESGDAYVGITFRPRGLDALKAFNAERYRTLSFADPRPNQVCAADGPVRDGREDLRWDIFSQVGALLKSNSPDNPLADFNVERLYATAHEGDLPTYVNAVHGNARLADGGPIYDGYIHKGDGYPTSISVCETAPAASDPRRMDHGADVPVVRLLTEGDVLTSFSMRRDDSDVPGDLYRLYEVAGSPHMDAAYYRHMPFTEDQVAAGQPAFLSNWPLGYNCEVDIPMADHPVFTYAANATLENIDRWVREGVPAPRADRIGVRNGGTAQAAFVKDEYGNAVGGVRSPYLDVPAATFHAKTPGPAVCGNLLRLEPFSWPQLESLYGSPAGYAANVAESVDRLVGERWLTASDGEKIKREAAGLD